MPYRFATDRPDYSDLASGKVLYSLPVYPAFPIRLASEIFQRCQALREAGNAAELPMLFDPCCGAAYHLCTLAVLHGESIRAITASDIDPKAVQFAGRNLGLLTTKGFDRRIDELAEDQAQFGKASHKEALESTRRIRENISNRTRMREIPTRVFQADAADASNIKRGL